MQELAKHHFKLRCIQLSSLHNITDAGIIAIAKIGTMLYYLEVTNTSVTLDGLNYLALHCTNLRYIEVSAAIGSVEELKCIFGDKVHIVRI